MWELVKLFLLVSVGKIFVEVSFWICINLIFVFRGLFRVELSLILFKFSVFVNLGIKILILSIVVVSLWIIYLIFCLIWLLDSIVILLILWNLFYSLFYNKFRRVL